MRLRHADVFIDECGCIQQLYGKAVYRCKHCGLGFTTTTHEPKCGLARGQVNAGDDRQRAMGAAGGGDGGDDDDDLSGYEAGYGDLQAVIGAMFAVVGACCDHLYLEELLKPDARRRVLPYMPGGRGSKVRYARLVEAIIEQRNIAAKDDLHGQRSIVWLTLLLLLPSIFLQRSNAVTSKVSQKEAMVARLVEPVKTTQAFIDRLIKEKSQGGESQLRSNEGEGIVGEAQTYDARDHPVGYDPIMAAAEAEAFSRIKLVEALTGLGELSKAANVLERKPNAILDTTDEVLLKLEALLPRRRPIYEEDVESVFSEVWPDRPSPVSPQPLPRVCLPTLKVLQRRVRKGRAFGVSGWVVEHTMGNFTDGQHLYSFLGDCANGELPDQMMKFMMGARMVPLDKGGPDGGVRPVAVGELFVKMAAVGALTTVVREAALFLAKEGQVGVSTKGGLDYIIHSVHAALLTDEEMVAALIDIENAYGTISRKLIRDYMLTCDIKDKLAPLLRYFDARYPVSDAEGANHPYDFVAQRPGHPKGEWLRLYRGIFQGDPLGPLFFALGMAAVRAAAKAKLVKEAVLAKGEVGAVFNAAVLDDSVFCGRPEVIAKEILAFKWALYYTQSDMRCHEHKQKVYPATEEATKILRGNKWLDVVKLVDRDDGLIVLGAPIGSDEFVKAQLLVKVKPYLKGLVAPLSVFPNLQVRLLLLHHCAARKIGFLLRMCHPSKTEEVACLHDNTMRQALADVMEFPWQDCVGYQYPEPEDRDPEAEDGHVITKHFLSSMPTVEGANIFVRAGMRRKLGGLGLGNAWLEKYAAWIASFFLAVKAAVAAVALSPGGGNAIVLKALERVFGMKVGPMLVEAKSFFSDGMEGANEYGVNITDAMLDKVPNAIWQECVEQVQRAPGDGIQRAISTVLDKIVWVHLVFKNSLIVSESGEFELRSPAEMAQIISNCQKGVGEALRAVPSDPLLEIPNAALSYHIRYVFNDSKLVAEEERVRSKCCPHGDAEHSRTCVKFGAMFDRHAYICQALRVCFTKMAGVNVSYDAKLDGQDGNSRPDLVVHGFGPRGSDTVVEVATVNQSAAGMVTGLRNASKVALFAAARREGSKTKKYQALVDATGGELKVAAVEVAGGFGKELNGLVDRIEARFNLSGRSLMDEFNTSFTTPTAAAYCNQIIGVAMIKGNAAAASKLRYNVS